MNLQYHEQLTKIHKNFMSDKQQENEMIEKYENLC